MKNTVSKINLKKVLVLSDYYLPGYKSGGGMRTIVNMVDRLKDKFQFSIITRDHDGKLDRQQYTNVEINCWNTIRDSKVFYLDRDNIKISNLRKLITEVNPDIIYCNSYFSTLTLYLLILRRLNHFSQKKIIIAPCGELSEGALQLNSKKKTIFVKFSRFFHLYKGIIWKASSELEKKEIEIVKEQRDEIFIAPDILPLKIFEEFDAQLKPCKNIGEVKMIFLSRFMKKKNFRWLLENLTDIRGKLEIDIYGPLEDAEYWDNCKQLIKKLPENIRVEAKGSVPHEQVLETLVKYHFFIMPTLGENFGHIFLEALAAGCPLLISDKTPWLNLEDKGIGWDLPLTKPVEWNYKLNDCIELTQTEYSKLSHNARQFALNVLNDEKYEFDTLRILEGASEKSQ